MARRLAVVLVFFAAAAVAAVAEAPAGVFWPLLVALLVAEVRWTVGFVRQMQAGERAEGSQ